MPFEILPESEGNIVAMRVWGTVSTDDFAELNKQLTEIAGRTGRIRILADWQGLVGWTEDARHGRFSMRVKYRGRVERMAILADSSRSADIARFAEVMNNAEVLRFDPARRDAALRWLKEP